MILTIAGIKYLDETCALITNEIKVKGLAEIFDVKKINLISSPQATSRDDGQRSRILVLTDRDCAGMAIKPDDCLNRIKDITSGITSDDFVIVNVDDTDLVRHIEGIKCRVVTFGFNSKACVTASSTVEDVVGAEYLCSLQSSIKSIYGNVIEPGEVKIIDKMECNVHSIMAYCCFLLISEIKKPGD